MPDGWMVVRMINRKGMWKEAVVAYFNVVYSISLDGLMKELHDNRN